MAPKKEATKAAKAGPSDGKDAFAFNHAESTLLWALVGQMCLLDRVNGVNFEVIKASVGSTTADAARQRWTGLCRRMKERGLPLPEPATKKAEPKAKKDGGRKKKAPKSTELVEDTDDEECEHEEDEEEEEDAKPPPAKKLKTKGKEPAVRKAKPVPPPKKCEDVESDDAQSDVEESTKGSGDEQPMTPPTSVETDGREAENEEVEV